MEKLRLWCGQPSDRGRLKNRTHNRTGGWWVAGVLQICILFSLVLSTANRVVGIIDAIGILGNESVPIQLAQSCWFPGLKHEYAILSNTTRKLLRLEITKILIAVYKKKQIYCVICDNFRHTFATDSVLQLRASASTRVSFTPISCAARTALRCAGRCAASRGVTQPSGPPSLS